MIDLTSLIMIETPPGKTINNHYWKISCKRDTRQLVGSKSYIHREA